jgi:outer membrane protein assembly factor BamB
MTGFHKSFLLLAAMALPWTFSGNLQAAENATVINVVKKNSGLCLHLGSGSDKNPRLTANLAEKSGMLIHGMALDQKALQRARKAISEKKMAGRAIVEKLFGKKLPYLKNLARVIVVENTAGLNSKGVTKKEIMRVLAPGGSLCMSSGGKWSVTVKPRPKEMDDWTHAHHGADGNLLSNDKTLTFPLGLRWIDGTPFGTGGFGSCAPCRVVVLAGGRCFAVSVDDPGIRRGKKQIAHLIARDAYSGFPLWQLDCKGTYSKVQLDWRNVWPLVATADKVYVKQGQKLLVVNAASGQIETSIQTKYEPQRLLLSGKVLLTACWEKMELSKVKDGFENDRIRAVWWPGGVGSLEAFDAQSGKSKWSHPLKVLTLLADGKTAYALTHEGNPPTKREVVALELASGKIKWRVPHKTFGELADTCLNFAGPGCVVVSKTKARGKREVFVLNESDGKILVRIPGTSARNLVGNELWCSNGRYDLKTGAKKPGPGIGNTYAGTNIIGGCVPPVVIAGRYVTSARRGTFFELPDDPKGRPKKHYYSGVRGACLMGFVPANGMLYTAQNNCACVGAQPGGFLAIGPSPAPPTAEDFKKERPIEKGPAFGSSGKPAAAGDWPTYRGNLERSGGLGAAGSQLPAELKQLWKKQCVPAPSGQFAAAWKGRIGALQSVSAPIIVGGQVIVAGVDSGEIISLDAVSGTRKWSALLGGRIDSPPTYHKGLLLVGCHNGWVYALRATDGVMAYRVRIAPLSRRMVDCGSVESAWPAVGAVLVYKNVAYATAGRSTEVDGGLALVAFNPATGKTLWARNLGAKLNHLIDALAIRMGELAFNFRRLNPETGADLPPDQRYYRQYTMISGAWSAGFSKRSGRGFSLGKVCANLMAWDDKLVVLGSIAVTRSKVDIPKASAKTKPKHPDRIKKEDLAWKTNLEPHSAWAKVNAMALGKNAVVFTGTSHRYCRIENLIGHFLWIKSTKDGSAIGKALKLEVPAAYDAIAISGGRVYIGLQDGSLICLGAK